MVFGNGEGGADAGNGGTRADQAGFGARTQRQAERIQEDRLAGAGLAGQHAEPRFRRQIQPVDQHEIADRQLDQHDPAAFFQKVAGACQSREEGATEPRAGAARRPGEPLPCQVAGDARVTNLSQHIGIDCI